MIFRTFEGHTPQLHPTVRAGENVTLIGEVTAGENVSFWYGTVARGDAGSIVIGSGTNIQDNCILHNETGIPTIVGRDVVVGHGVILHSCNVGGNCLVGMGAILLNGCVIGAGSIVAAGAVVTENKVFPPNSLLMGTPARVVRTVTPEEQADNLRSARHYAEKAVEELPLVTEQI
jgi:carbonic anhydrase/acetyltransferase-like protein (isoleucine patch superfamily)